ncbi:MAG: hypothetical protein U0325_31185 [Polyangiales bacterium]
MFHVGVAHDPHGDPRGGVDPLHLRDSGGEAGVGGRGGGEDVDSADEVDPQPQRPALRGDAARRALQDQRSAHHPRLRRRRGTAEVREQVRRGPDAGHEGDPSFAATIAALNW